MNNAIFIIVNSHHFHYAIAFLNSLVENWPNHPTILCNHTADLNQEQLKRLASYDKLSLHLLELKPEEIGNRPVHKSDGMLVAYGKFRLWSNLYEAFDTLLFLDVDTLVLKPLDDLIQEQDFKIFRAEHRLQLYGDPDEIRTKLSEDGLLDYFNANLVHEGIGANTGVMVIPKPIRTQDNYECLLSLLDRYKAYDKWWADQSTINIWMLKKNIPRPSNTELRYNFLTFYLSSQHPFWTNQNLDLDVEFKNIHILHFVIKPEEILKHPSLKTAGIPTPHSQKSYDLFEYYLKQRE